MFVKLRFVIVSAVDVGAVEADGGNFTVAIRSDVSCLTRMRTSRDARTPLPCVLPSAEHCVEETVV
jgi:hypothetical protein